jgi:amidase
MPYFAQELFEQAERTAGHDAAAYTARRATLKRLAGAGGLDRLLAAQHLEALLAPTLGPAWTTDLVNGDHVSDSATTLPAVAGYPHLTVPMGLVRGLPVGLSLIGPAWSEARLLAMGFAFEQRAHARRPPTYAPQIER